MGFADDFIAARRGAELDESQTNDRWLALRRSQEAQVDSMAQESLAEAARGLEGAGIQPDVVTVVDSGTAIVGWRLRSSFRDKWCWITNDSRAIFAHFQEVTIDGRDCRIPRDSLITYGFPADAFVISYLGKLIVHLESREGQVSWEPFDEWLLTHMRAIGDGGYVGDEIPTSISGDARAIALGWANRRNMKHELANINARPQGWPN